MKHFGETFRQYIDSHRLRKRDLAASLGMSEANFYTIFRRPSVDCELMERLCVATGLPVSDFLEGVTYEFQDPTKNMSDNKASTFVGDASVHIGNNDDFYEKLLAEKDRIISEKERYIKILEKLCPALVAGTESEQPTTGTPAQS